jgi:hypothetical protein
MNQSLAQISTIDALITQVLQGRFNADPASLPVVGSFAVKQNTRFPGSEQTFHNNYLLVRVGTAFGGCCVESQQLADIEVETLAGQTLAQLLENPQLPVRIAALDAYFGVTYPHSQQTAGELIQLPFGTPLERAVARDEAIVALLDIQPGQKVGLIGVVNPIVDAITSRGGICLPCDFNMTRTASGIEVQQDMRPVLAQADQVIATGMTLSNGSFDAILDTVRQRQIPLVVYAQTGSAIVPRFLGQGVSGAACEIFPYSQFSAEPSGLCLYRSTS